MATSDHTISCNRLWQKMLVRLDLDLRKNYPVKMSEKMKNCPFLYQIFFSSLFTLMGKFLNLYGVRNLEMSIRFSLKSRPSEWFHRAEMSQIKAEISLPTNVKLIFHRNVGLKWYQWIPDFYNIRFEQNNLTEKNYVGSNLML